MHGAALLFLSELRSSADISSHRENRLVEIAALPLARDRVMAHRYLSKECWKRSPQPPKRPINRRSYRNCSLDWLRNLLDVDSTRTSAKGCGQRKTSRRPSSGKAQKVPSRGLRFLVMGYLRNHPSLVALEDLRVAWTATKALGCINSQPALATRRLAKVTGGRRPCEDLR